MRKGPEWDFERSQAEDGALHAVAPHFAVTVQPHDKAELFFRNFIKPWSAEKEHRRAIVAGIGGVRAYVLGNLILIGAREWYLDSSWEDPPVQQVVLLPRCGRELHVTALDGAGHGIFHALRLNDIWFYVGPESLIVSHQPLTLA